MRPSARALDCRVGRLPCGPRNDLSDVAGVKVGHLTLRFGQGAKVVRSGVTAILPNPSWGYQQRVRAGVHILNGAGELSGLAQIGEWGLVETPILLTHTMGVGMVYHAVARAMTKRFRGLARGGQVVIPVVGECDDSFLSDVWQFPIEECHVNAALEAAEGAGDAPFEQGDVGAGTGMTAFDFKAGIGSASRRVGTFTLGCLTLVNFGRSHDLLLPGKEQWRTALAGYSLRPDVAGSLIVVLACDAPLHSHDLARLAQRAGLGAARVGSNAYHGSGEIFVAFSTAQPIRRGSSSPRSLRLLEEEELNPLFLAAVEATQEAIVNSLCCAHACQGRGGASVPAFPSQVLRGARL